MDELASANDPRSMVARGAPVGKPGELSRFRKALAACRTGLALLSIGLYVLIFGPLGMFIAMVHGSPAVLYRLGTVGVRVALAITGIRYRAVGREHVQAGRAAVYCANHRSNVEPPIIYDVLWPTFPRLRILYKAELRGLPILGRAFTMAGFVPIRRGHKEQSTQAIEQAAEALARGDSFMIFPEGTRSRTGELLPFKKGGFVMAIKAQVPIVPIAIQGAERAMRKGSPIIWPVTVSVRIGEPIETTGLHVADRDRLIARVRSSITTMLAQGPV